MMSQNSQVNGQPRECVFSQINARSENRGECSGRDAGEHAGQKCFEANVSRMNRGWKEWALTEERATHDGRGGAGERDGNQAAWLELEEQKLHRQCERGHRCGKRCRHSGRRAGDQ